MFFLLSLAVGDHVQRSPGSVSDNFRYHPNYKDYVDGDVAVTTGQPISKSRSHESQLYKLSSVGTIPAPVNINSSLTE